VQFELSEDQHLVQKTARDFATAEVLPKAAEIDREHRHPAELVARMAELGFLGIAVPDQWGGAGMDHVSYVVAMEEISRACASTGVIMSVNNSLACDPIHRFGTDAQKRAMLPAVAGGKNILTAALAEEGLRDPLAPATRARREASTWKLDGAKAYVINADRAERFVVFAQVDAALGWSGVGAFIVDKNTPGVTVLERSTTLGLDAASFGGLELKVLHTPGHTPGSVCLYDQAGTLFSGDTLFEGGPGATAFRFGDFEVIIRSISEQLLVLPGETAVRTGHGPSTTIGAEAPHLPAWIRRGW